MVVKYVAGEFVSDRESHRQSVPGVNMYILHHKFLNYQLYQPSQAIMTSSFSPGHSGWYLLPSAMISRPRYARDAISYLGRISTLVGRG